MNIHLTEGIAILSLILSVIALWRTRTSLRVFRDHDDGACVTVTNNSPHAVTITQIGFLETNGELAPFVTQSGFDPPLPHRIDPRDSVKFSVPLGFTIAEAAETQKNSRGGVYVRIASGQLWGNRGSVVTDVPLIQRLIWRVTTRNDRSD